MSGQQPLSTCRTGNLNPPSLTSRRSQPPLALSVPLSRFTSQVGGGSAFFVRPLDTFMKTKIIIVWSVIALLTIVAVLEVFDLHPHIEYGHHRVLWSGFGNTVGP